MLIKKTKDMTDSERIAVENSNNQYLRTLTYAPVGMIIPFGGGTLPSAFLVCDGSALDTTEYADLFNAIGYTYGGSDDTFNIPNLSGATVNGISVKYIIKTANGITEEERLEILANVDQTYNSTSENAQSGVAVAEAISTKEDKNYLAKYFTYTVADNKATITKCDISLSGNIVIPDMFGGYPVTTINSGAFYYCEKLTNITIPNSVTDIWDRAFDECYNLKSIKIPNSVTYIHHGAFEDCNSLTDVYYAGSEEDRQNITIGTNNTNLLNATWHYNQAVATKEYVDEKAGDVDQTYDATSKNAQSGIAMAGALNGYVQKVKGNGHTKQVYAVDANDDTYGDTTMIVEDNAFFETGFDYGQIPTRQGNGNLMTNTPVKDLDCVNLAYVNAAISNLSGLKVVIVAELHESGEADTLYFLPTSDTQDQNLYDEYIYTNGAWEKIGSAAVEVDLSDYVKNTDYATNMKAGIIKATQYHGLKIAADGDMEILGAGYEEIDAKKQFYHPITPLTLDYAVKVGLTTNTETLTDEEKTAAQSWLGINSYELVEEITVESEGNVNKTTTPDGQLYSSLYQNMLVSIYNATDKASTFAYMYRGDGYLCMLTSSLNAGEFGTLKSEIITPDLAEWEFTKRATSGYGTAVNKGCIETSNNVSRILIGGCTAGTVIKIYGMKA